MLLDTELAGHTTPWLFPGGRGLAAWLADAPWAAEGGAAIVHLSGEDDGYGFMPVLEREIFGQDCGRNNVRVELISGAVPVAGLRETIFQWFQISPDATPWQAREALAQVFAARPTCIVCAPAALDLKSDPWNDAMDLLDELSKSAIPSTPIFILLDNKRQRLHGRRSFDFIRGKPSSSILDTEHATDISLWRAYLHTRLAWESGGDPSTAQAMNMAVIGKLRCGDDDQLEKALNDWAIEQWQAIPKKPAEQLGNCLSRPEATSGQLACHAAELESAGLIWRPWGTARRAPVPWVSRALLGRYPQHQRRWLLRSALVCIPLVNEILSHCQDLEQQIKASILVAPGEAHAVPDDVERNWERFRRGKDATTRYPSNHPAPPDKPEDAWFFASLGTFLNAPESPLSRSYTDEETSLSRLRNTMAHGHYAAWFHLKLLREIMQTCSP